MSFINKVSGHQKNNAKRLITENYQLSTGIADLFSNAFPPRRLLLIKPSSMGDIIHALPVVAALHQAWPKTEIRWLIHPAFQEVIAGHPALGEPLLFPREEFRGISGAIRSLFWARTLREWLPDLAIDLQGLLRSALMAHYSGAKRILGLSDAREGASFFYSATATVSKKDHAVTRYLSILDLLGIPQGPPAFFLPEGKIPKGFLIKEPFVVLHPYARGEAKNLNEEQVIAFCKALGSVSVILVGQGEKINSLPSNASDWTGRTTLLELIGILRKASFIVSSDSGPMHLAVALQPAKTLAIHRWSDPLRVGPWAAESFVWKSGIIARKAELTESFRSPGHTPSLEEMREIGLFVLKILNDVPMCV